MDRILVSIEISELGSETIKSMPELMKKELAYIDLWKTEQLLEHFYISVSKKEAVLIFKNVNEASCKEMIEILPYFPYMSKVEYLFLNQQF